MISIVACLGRIMKSVYLFIFFLGGGGGGGLTSVTTHYTGHITTGSFVGKGNQYIQLVKVLYCKLSSQGT